MGGWGTGVFENDGAGDFLAEFCQAELAQRADVVSRAMQAATEAADYLEIDEGQAAVAAAAVVAAARGGRPVTAGDSAKTFGTGDLPQPEPDLVALAVRALDRVTADDSEWMELWQESPELSAALGAVAEVRAALA
jgi:uncharacterized protein DUF4259